MAEKPQRITINNQEDLQKHIIQEQNRELIALMLVGLHTRATLNSTGDSKGSERSLSNFLYDIIEDFFFQVGGNLDEWLTKLVEYADGDDLNDKVDNVLDILIYGGISDFIKSQEKEQEYLAHINLIAELVVEDEIEAYVNNFEKLKQVKQLFEYPGEQVIQGVMYFYLGIDGGSFDKRIPEDFKKFDCSQETLELIRLAIVKKFENYLNAHVDHQSDF